MGSSSWSPRTITRNSENACGLGRRLDHAARRQEIRGKTHGHISTPLIRLKRAGNVEILLE